MKKPVRVILIGEANAAFKKLNEVVGLQIEHGKENTDEMQLLNSIKQKINSIKSNPFYGDNIKKEQIPRGYDVQNLWRVELSQFWRMLYTVRGDKIEVICFVIDILSHPSYDKKFGYRKK